MNPYNSVLEALHTGDLLPAGGPVFIGLSGGIDSAVLFHILMHINNNEGMGWTITVLHLDHRLRPESGEDARSVRDLAGKMGVGFRLGTADVTGYCAAHGVSIEAGARACRLAFYRKHAASVVLAHQRDDQVETVLYDLVRGTGFEGLAGMAGRETVNGLELIRPMLALPRSAVAAYAAEHGITFREDPSNNDPRFTRNRIRHELLPLLRSLNPQSDAHIAGTAGIVRQGWALIRATVDPVLESVIVSAADGRLVLDRRTLAACPAAIMPFAVYRLLGRAGLTPSRQAVDQVCGLACRKAGGTVREDLAGGGTMTREYDKLVITASRRKSPALVPERKTHVPGRLAVPEKGIVLTFDVYRLSALSPAELHSHGPEVEFADLGAAEGLELTVRTRRPGDRFRPLGSPGERKLQDCLVDAKVPADARDDLLLVECRGTIVWVAGLRLSEHARVTEQTQCAVRMTCMPDPGHGPMPGAGPVSNRP